MSKKADITVLSESRLAPYAASYATSRGRRHKEDEHRYRYFYQRDRERIIHTTAFRRLEYKTQVFVNHEGDYYRTRLTHTIEVSQIARTIARALSLNEDLTEAIALAHDLGHTPFGHSGEETLDRLMKDCGGFDHNIQSLRVVDVLEQRYPDFEGLNLTFEVREGIVRHNSSFDNPPVKEEFACSPMPTLEAQVVDLSDEIAYYSHDIDDGLRSRILSEQAISELEICKSVNFNVKGQDSYTQSEQKRYQLAKGIINAFVSDLVDNTNTRISKFNISTYEKARQCPEKIVQFSAPINRQRAELRDFLFENFYRHYRVMRMANKAKFFIEKLFELYCDNPVLLPGIYAKKAMDQALRRAVICDYIAGMTDRYALDEYKKLFQPYERV
ncbi:MAG: deoxyguanosinetriphosphate triphosphohydrolase [Candidatus Omnitrophica bacterium]|nr:deoxyguanosinetriphosphate triphosphohydrolase [Candidatus Omnitrophota bacterium]